MGVSTRGSLRLEGVIPPLVTPLTPDGDLDEHSLRRLCERLIGAGVAGLFVGGSTGEVALLADSVRDAVTRIAVEVSAGRIPVLAGVIDTGTRRVIAHARTAMDAGADAVVATPPFYVQPHADEIVRHYREIAGAVDVPVIAYNIPSATHVPLPLAASAELIADDIVVAFKDSSGDLAGFRALLELASGTEVTVLTGSEVIADTAIAVGGAGIVPGLGNVDPEGYVRLYELARRGDLAAAAAEQARLVRLFGIVDVADRRRIGATAAALGAFKVAMVLRGFIDCDATSSPLNPLTAEEGRSIEALVRAAALDVIERDSARALAP